MHNRILVTGGAGFIGSNFILQEMREGTASILNFDKLTYAGNLHNLESIADDPRYRFVQGDIGNRAEIKNVLQTLRPTAIVHFAAESHVDRSIRGPEDFIQTNINGTFALLEETRAYWSGLEEQERKEFRFLHVSTDEVYVRSDRTIRHFLKRRRMLRTVRTRRRRQRQIIWSAPITTPMNSRRLRRTVPIIMDGFSFPRN